MEPTELTTIEDYWNDFAQKIATPGLDLELTRQVFFAGVTAASCVLTRHVFAKGREMCEK